MAAVRMARGYGQNMTARLTAELIADLVEYGDLAQGRERWDNADLGLGYNSYRWVTVAYDQHGQRVLARGLTRGEQLAGDGSRTAWKVA